MQETGNGVIIDNPAFIHPTALVYGKVRLSKGVSLWPYSVIRSEVYEVVIGEMTNIQDFVMIHVGLAHGVYIGNHCSITHRCTLHGCTIGDNCLVGIGATIMDGSIIGSNCVIAAHTFLKEGTIIPDNSIVAGTPGNVIKTRNCGMENKANAMWYFQNSQGYKQENHRYLSCPEGKEALEQSVAALKAI